MSLQTCAMKFITKLRADTFQTNLSLLTAIFCEPSRRLPIASLGLPRSFLGASGEAAQKLPVNLP